MERLYVFLFGLNDGDWSFWRSSCIKPGIQHCIRHVMRLLNGVVIVAISLHRRVTIPQCFECKTSPGIFIKNNNFSTIL
jgi:hypothetical protein